MLCGDVRVKHIFEYVQKKNLLSVFRDDIDEAEQKEGSQEIKHPVFSEGMSHTAGKELDERVTGETEAETVGNRPRERNGCDGEEGGNADLRVVPLDACEARSHE